MITIEMAVVGRFMPLLSMTNHYRLKKRKETTVMIIDVRRRLKRHIHTVCMQRQWTDTRIRIY
jgi:hypothetical protein